MTVKAIGNYDFPSSDRAELFGDDQLVHVRWRGNMALCAAAAFRAPKAMTWAEFRSTMVDPWAASDPDYDPDSVRGWTLDEAEFTPDPEVSLAHLGVGHKSVLSFTTS
ncbi:MAG TPA: phenol hydroxylase subunit P4 [Acidimicrobiales bacterium]|jgi:phenol hydroxylase P4 protein|nr:phenol hydroxylase subunit P4 [Acidimicrobiales bacterium]